MAKMKNELSVKQQITDHINQLAPGAQVDEQNKDNTAYTISLFAMLRHLRPDITAYINQDDELLQHYGEDLASTVQAITDNLFMDYYNASYVDAQQGGRSKLDNWMSAVQFQPIKLKGDSFMGLRGGGTIGLSSTPAHDRESFVLTAQHGNTERLQTHFLNELERETGELQQAITHYVFEALSERMHQEKEQQNQDAVDYITAYLPVIIGYEGEQGGNVVIDVNPLTSASAEYRMQVQRVHRNRPQDDPALAIMQEITRDITASMANGRNTEVITLRLNRSDIADIAQFIENNEAGLLEIVAGYKDRESSRNQSYPQPAKRVMPGSSPDGDNNPAPPVRRHGPTQPISTFDKVKQGIIPPSISSLLSELGGAANLATFSIQNLGYFHSPTLVIAPNARWEDKSIMPEYADFVRELAEILFTDVNDFTIDHPGEHVQNGARIIDYLINVEKHPERILDRLDDLSRPENRSKWVSIKRDIYNLSQEHIAILTGSTQASTLHKLTENTGGEPPFSPANDPDTPTDESRAAMRLRSELPSEEIGSEQDIVNAVLAEGAEKKYHGGGENR